MSMKDDSTVVIDNISEYINAGTVVIGNSCVEGINRIFWNGCDENGVFFLPELTLRRERETRWRFQKPENITSL